MVVDENKPRTCMYCGIYVAPTGHDNRWVDSGGRLNCPDEVHAHLPEKTEDIKNAAEGPEGAARRFAHELGRLAEGLEALEIPLRDGPVHGAEVDTALEVIHELRARVVDYQKVVEEWRRAQFLWLKRNAELDRVVSGTVNLLKAEGFVRF